MKLNKKQGISLIVLVITIIVMIILAAAIILSLSSSGIIGRANEATTETDEASAKEIITIAHAEWLLMDEMAQQNNGGSFATYAQQKLDNAGMDSTDYIINEDGTYSEYVASIEDVKYWSLKDAIADTKRYTPVTIVLNNDVNETISISSTREITLDLNGYTMASKNTTISNSGSLVIKDSSVSKTGMIKASGLSKELYDSKCDLNNNGVIDEGDIDIINNNFNANSSSENWEELQKYDIDGSGQLDVLDIGEIINSYNAGYAVYNATSESILVLEGISEEKIIGVPEGIYNKGGNVTWK